MPTTTQQRSKLRFRERAELLDFMLEVSAATTETLDLDELLQNVGNIVRRVLHYELFAILLFNEREKDLRICYAVGHREEIIRNLSIHLGEGITGAAAQKREAILVKDVRLDDRYLSSTDAVRTELAVPTLTRGRLVGVIDVQSTRLAPIRKKTVPSCAKPAAPQTAEFPGEYPPRIPTKQMCNPGTLASINRLTGF